MLRSKCRQGSRTARRIWIAVGCAAVLLSSPRWASAQFRGDFNGDGFDDLAIGVDHEDLNGIADCGAVNVLFGSRVGLDTPRQQFLSQTLAGVGGVAEELDDFGGSLLAVDVNRDGRADLFVGVTGEDTGRGAMNVFLGKADGLRPFKFVSAKVKGGVRVSDEFAFSFAAGDFDGNGTVEIAVGVPGDEVLLSDGTIVTNAGSVTVFLGGPNFQFLTEGTGSTSVKQFNLFGSSLGARP